MDQNALRRLAGLPTLSYAELFEKKKHLGEIKPKVEVPEGTFTKKAATIVKTLIGLHDGDIGKASKALTFYINRAGAEVSNKEELDAAKALFKEKITNEELALVRRRSGLPALVSEAKDEEKDEEKEAEESPAEEKSEGEEKEATVDDIPAIIKKIAKKAEGKSFEELEELLQKVYDAGFKDGQKAEEEPKEEESEEKAEEEPKEVKESNPLIPKAEDKLTFIELKEFSGYFEITNTNDPHSEVYFTGSKSECLNWLKQNKNNDQYRKCDFDITPVKD